MVPADALAELRAALAVASAGDAAGAEQRLRRLLRVRGLEPAIAANAENLLGTLARRRGDAAAALRHTAAALAIQPQTAAFLANHGGALAEAGRLAPAIAAFRAALAVRPQDAVTLRNLGQALAASGDAAGALVPLAEATRLDPAAPEPWLALAHAQREAGQPSEASAAAERALAAAGDQTLLAEQARFLLAALGAAPAPDRAPAGYVRDLFDQYAPRFDAELTEKLCYRTPAALAALLAEAGVAAARQLDVLDLGCGTGLSGLALAPFARRLDGLDLSPRMLAEARRLGIYAALHEADLLDFLPAHPARFDLIAAADVLNYLGDLAPALAGIAKALRPGGIAAFSVETGDVAPFALHDGLRYRHAPGAVAALAEAAGLVPLRQQATTLRQDRGQAVSGELFLFKKA